MFQERVFEIFPFRKGERAVLWRNVRVSSSDTRLLLRLI